MLAGCAGVIGLGDYSIHDDPNDAGLADAPPAALDVVVAEADVAPPPPFTCPDGQVVSVDRCFFLNPTLLDQPSAKAACDEAGAHLAVLRNDEENARVGALGADLDAARWIGFEGPPEGTMNDRAKYAWLTGERFDYTNWRDSDPNGDSSCVAYFEPQVDEPHAYETWVDRPCAVPFPSICSRP